MEGRSMPSPQSSAPTAEPERRRRRPAVSCGLCRRRKIKCNRESPCSNCLRSKNNICVYEKLSPPPSRRLDHGQPTVIRMDSPVRDSDRSVLTDNSFNTGREDTLLSRPSLFTIATSTGPSTPGSQISAREVEFLKSKIKRLEDQLSRATNKSVASSATSPNFNLATTTSHLVGTFHINHETPMNSHEPPISRMIMHKTRVFGQSHWMAGMTQFAGIVEMLEPIVQDEGAKAVVGLLKCKQLAKIIKARRTPPWPTPVTSDLPPKEVADALVDIYLRTYETIYRVLHIPSFKRDYDALWLPGKIHDTAFLVQLKLIFAIGATMYDDHFTLRTSAIRWVHEAQTWSSEPEFKSRLTIQFLQTSILLLLARESVGVDGSLTWISVGNVMRTAMHMGLHRDPLVQAKRTLFSSEMRRRLWNTIVELALQTSMESGGPPLLSMEDFDTQPPGNFDDDQIESEDPTPKPEGIFTGMSIALSLRQMFPLRLDIARSLNALGMQRGYEETLRLDSELRACYKTVCMTLQRHRLVNSSAQTAFGVHALDFIINRYIIGLHSPYFSASHKGVAFAFSRKVVVETALKIWSAVYPSSIMAPSPFEDPSRPKNDYLTRLARCGYGVFRKSPMQACFLVAAELRAQLQEEHSLGPVPLRRDLLSVLEDGKKWSLNSITAGETNIKGYLFLSWVDTLIHGMVRGIPKDQFPEILMKTGEDVVAQCLEIFEQKLDENPDLVGVNVDNLDELAFDISPDWIDSWGFLLSTTQLEPGGGEPMNWMYND